VKGRKKEKLLPKGNDRPNYQWVVKSETSKISTNTSRRGRRSTASQRNILERVKGSSITQGRKKVKKKSEFAHQKYGESNAARLVGKGKGG